MATTTPQDPTVEDPTSTAIIPLLNRVMLDVGSVGKREQNEQQGFTFRGVDTVVNAVSPALRRYGIVGPVPRVVNVERGTVEVGRNRTPMGHVQVTIEFTLYGPNGDSLSGSATAEAMDSGDKATAKAHSVAERTFLIQTLCLPTHETDPDLQVYRRSDPNDAPAQVAPAEETNPNEDLINEVFTLAQQTIGPSAVLKLWAESHDGQHISKATDAGGLELLRDDLQAQIAREAQ